MNTEIQKESLILKEIYWCQDMLECLTSILQPVTQNTISCAKEEKTAEPYRQTKVMESIAMMKWRIEFLIENVTI